MGGRKWQFWTLGSGSTEAPAHPGQVVSSILRNLSWRADINSKKVLREVGSMTALMECVLRASKVSMRSLGLGRSEGATQRLRVGRHTGETKVNWRNEPTAPNPPASHTRPSQAEDESADIHVLDRNLTAEPRPQPLSGLT